MKLKKNNYLLMNSPLKNNGFMFITVNNCSNSFSDKEGIEFNFHFLT